MSENTFPQFAVIALDAHNLKKQAEEDKKRKEEQKNLDHLFESLKTVLGEDADEIIAGGEFIPGIGSREAFWRFQEFGFKSQRGSWCGDADNFQIAAVYKNGNDLWKTQAHFGWSVVRDTVEIGRLIEQWATYNAKDEKNREEIKTNDAKPRRLEAQWFDLIATRFQRGYESPLDKALLALKLAFDNLSEDSSGYDQDDDSDDDRY